MVVETLKADKPKQNKSWFRSRLDARKLSPGSVSNPVHRPTCFVACFRCWWGRDRPSMFGSRSFIFPTVCTNYFRSTDPINGKFLTPKVGIETTTLCSSFFQSMVPVYGKLWHQRFVLKEYSPKPRKACARPLTEIIHPCSPLFRDERFQTTRLQSLIKWQYPI